MKIYTGIYSDLAALRLQSLIHRTKQEYYFTLSRSEDGEIVIESQLFGNNQIDTYWGRDHVIRYLSPYVSRKGHCLEFRFWAYVLVWLVDLKTWDVPIDIEKISKEIIPDSEPKRKRFMTKFKGESKDMIQAECFGTFKDSIKGLVKECSQEIRNENMEWWKRYNKLQTEHEEIIKKLKKNSEDKIRGMIEEYLKLSGKKTTKTEINKAKKLFLA